MPRQPVPYALKSLRGMAFGDTDALVRLADSFELPIMLHAALNGIIGVNNLTR